MNRKLKAKIVERFESQANFAEIIQTHEATVSRVIRGRRTLSVDDQKRWADALNCKTDIFNKAGVK